MFDLVSELTATYRPPSPKMIQRMAKICDSIPDDAREDVYNAILEELGANAQVGVNNITDACKKIGVPFSETHYIPAEMIVCDGCGKEFRYHPAPSEDDKIDKEIYDFCPDCGLQVYWTQIAARYKAMGIKCEWYERALNDAKDWGPNKPNKQRKIKDLTLTRGGVYWSRAKAESERREERRIKVDAKLDEIDRAKRWDTELEE